MNNPYKFNSSSSNHQQIKWLHLIVGIIPYSIIMLIVIIPHLLDPFQDIIAGTFLVSVIWSSILNIYTALNND